MRTRSRCGTLCCLAGQRKLYIPEQNYEDAFSAVVWLDNKLYELIRRVKPFSTSEHIGHIGMRLPMARHTFTIHHRLCIAPSIAPSSSAVRSIFIWRFDMSQNGLGAALRKLRERRTLNLREMGQLSSVDHAYIHRLETGEKTSPSGDMLSKLLKVLKPSERDTDIIEWLATHPDADPELVEHVLDDASIDFSHFTAAAGTRHRGTARPDPATLIARIKRAFEED